MSVFAMEVLQIKYLNVKNCLLHFPQALSKSYTGSSVCGIKLNYNNKDYYFSSNPLPCSELKPDFIGISAFYARVLGLIENTPVVLSRIYNIGSLKRIEISPETQDDFEIIHAANETIEHNLLNQLRIVWPGQKFCCWVTPNMPITFIIDSIKPDLNFGRLEEYSEVVVLDALKVKNDNENEDPYKKYLEIQEKEINFRCVPIDEDRKSIINAHPFTVYAHMKNLPSWAIVLIEKQETIWKLKTPEMELMVQLSSAENYSFCKGKDIAGFRNLYVSQTVAKYLKAGLGTKFELELAEEAQKSEIIGLIVTPLFHIEEIDKEEIKTEIYQLLFNNILKFGPLLLNSKCEFPLGEKKVMLTLRPLNVNWGFLELTDLKELLISVALYKRDEDIVETLKSMVENSIGSMNEILNRAKMCVLYSFGLNKFQQNMAFIDNFLVIGKQGAGKTTLAMAFLQQISGPPYYVFSETLNCFSLKGKRIEVITKALCDKLNQCKAQQPSVLCLENISCIAGTPNPEHENSEASLHMNRVSLKIIEIISEYQRENFILVLATVGSEDELNINLEYNKGNSIFPTRLTIPALTMKDRAEFLKILVLKKYSSAQISDEVYEEIAKDSDGFLPSDIMILFNKAVFEAWQRKVETNSKLELLGDDLRKALKITLPSSLHGLNLHKEIQCTWDNIGGMQSAKDKLTEIIIWPTKYPEIMNQCPLKILNSVLIYGAPGTGKTLLANAVAGESKLNFISVKGPELMSKYIGQSEEGVRKIFEKAQAAKPCLLFFDEFDSLAPRRGKDQTGVTDRVVNQLLTALDGVEPLTGVWVIAATSRPDLIDPALLRPGRIGTSIMCPFPNESARLEILNSLSSNLKLDDDVDLKVLAKRTANFSGADLKGLFTTAQIKLIDKIVEGSFELESKELPVINQEDKSCVVLKQEHLLSALEECKPSLNKSERTKYEKIYSEYRNPIKIINRKQKLTFA